MAADGSITIDSKLNNADFKVGARDLSKAIKALETSSKKSSADMAKSASGYGNAMRTGVQAAREFKSELKQLEGKAAELRKQLEANSNVKAFVETQREINSLKREIDAARKALHEMYEQEGKGVSSQQVTAAQDSVNSMIARYKELYQKRKELERPSDAEIVNYTRSEHALQEMETRIDGLRQAGSEMGSTFSIMARNAGSAIGVLASTAARVSFSIARSLGKVAITGLSKLASAAMRAASSIARIAGSAALSFLKKLASGAKNAAIQLMKLAGRAIQSGIQKLGQLAGGAAKHLLGIGKATHKSNGGFKMGLKTLLKYGLGIRSLFFLFRRLRQAVSDGLGEIAKQNPRVAAAVNSLKGALNGLKGSLATAFAPILTAIAPALTTLINLLTTAINTIGAFFAALTGQGFFNKATAAISGTGGAAKSASGSVKELKRQLAGFDELEILTANDSGGGGGGGGGGGAGGGFAYETVEIADGIKEFADQLRKMWAAADFEGIGSLIADKMNGMLERAKKLISWDNLGDSITKGIDAITGIINGFVRDFDWDLLGRTFGEGFNTFVKTITLFFEKIDLKAIGKGFAEALNGLVDEVDFDALSDMFSEGINKIIEGLTGFVDEIRPDELASKITSALNRFVKRVDWLGLSDAMVTGINKALNALLTVVSEFDWGESARKFVGMVNNLATKPGWDVMADLFTTFINGVLDSLLIVVRDFQWGDSAKKFVATVNNLVTKPHWDVMAETIKLFINGVLDAMTVIVRDFSWGEAGTKFGSALVHLYDPNTFTKIGNLLAIGINGAVDAMRNAIRVFSWKTNGGVDAGADFAKGVNTLIGTVNWVTLGNTLAAMLRYAVGYMKGAVTTIEWGNSGTKFASAINAFFQDHALWADAGTTISETFKGLLDFTKLFFVKLDTTTAAQRIRSALEGIDWKGIAADVWESIKTAFLQAGNFIDVLLGGTGTKYITREQQNTLNNTGSYIAERLMGNTTVIEDMTAGDYGNVLGTAIKKALGFVKNFLDNDIPWSTWGEKIRAFIDGMDWRGIGTIIGEAFKTAAIGLIDLILTTLYGNEWENNPTVSTLFPTAANNRRAEKVLKTGGISAYVFHRAFNDPDEKTAEAYGQLYEIMQSGGKVAEATSNVFSGFVNTLSKLNPLAEKTEEIQSETVEDFWDLFANEPALSPYGDPAMSPEAAGAKFEYVGAQLEEARNALTKNTKAVDGNTDTMERPDIPFPNESDWETPFISGWGNLGADTFFWDFLTGNEEQTVDVGVNYYPNGQSPNSTFANTGLGKWLKQITDPKTPVETKIALLKQGWNTIQAFIGTDNPLSAIITLVKLGWSALEKFVGTDNPLGAFIKLIKDGWKDPKTWIGIFDTLFAAIGLKKEGWSGIYKWVGILSPLLALITLGKSGWGGIYTWIGILKPLTALIGLGKSGWGGIYTWIGILKPLLALIGLGKSGWSGIYKWIGILKPLTTLIGLGKSGWETIKGWLTGNKDGKVGITITLEKIAKGVKEAIQNIKNLLFASGGVITSGGVVKRFASGGAISKSGRTSWWNSVQKYASGSRRAHGTLFVAGEAGPEVVGHVGGRTEVLNKSQLAQVMYNAVTTGMINALRGLTFQIPAAATGSIVPYEVAAQIERSGREIQSTLDANNEELIQAMTSAIGSAVLSIVGAINSQSNRGATGSVNAQNIIDEINRRTQMFSQSPLMGV